MEVVQRKTFEEGDKVVVRNVEREGTVTKRRGDFYNVTLDPAKKSEENNVSADDLVKASFDTNNGLSVLIYVVLNEHEYPIAAFRKKEEADEEAAHLGGSVIELDLY